MPVGHEPSAGRGVKPVASLSLDLDNEWAYLKTRGDAAWRDHPSYLDAVLPWIEAALQPLHLRLTVFVVGQDAALARNHAALRRLAAAGHEIANHSMGHEPWLHQRPPAEMHAELQAAEEAIAGATGLRPRGFRGPGFCQSPMLLAVLAQRGYAYDASTFPSILGPVARAYYLMRSGADAQQRRRLAGLFGGWRDGFQPLSPFRWQIGAETVADAAPDGPPPWPSSAQLLELPVTTLPMFRLPMHMSYVLFLAQGSPALAVAYFRAGLALCRLRDVAPSVLLHPLDFLDAQAVPSLRFFPTMNVPAAKKRAVVQRCLATLTDSFEVLPLGRFAERIQSPQLTVRWAHAA